MLIGQPQRFNRGSETLFLRDQTAPESLNGIAKCGENAAHGSINVYHKYKFFRC